MNKKIIKILSIIIYIIFITSIIVNVSTASITGTFKGDLNGANVDPIKDIISSVLIVIRMVGVFIAVGILMVLGVKYMIASAGDRADIKKHAITYVIGALILFATSGIAGIIKEIVDAAFPAGG